MGQRDEAIALAQHHQDFALALLVASNCGDGKKYQEVVRTYAKASFPSVSPLHLASLLFSSQAASAINPPHSTQHPVPGTIRLSGAMVPSVTGGGGVIPTPTSESTPPSLLKYWQRNLAMILANKPPGKRPPHTSYPIILYTHNMHINSSLTFNIVFFIIQINKTLVTSPLVTSLSSLLFSCHDRLAITGLCLGRPFAPRKPRHHGCTFRVSLWWSTPFPSYRTIN